tara:strand:+ start:8241 stop:12917 length:4677 start_codon:yes stop_codon:yes gene_type:complete
MPKRPIDRGDLLRGLNRTSRDSRAPASSPRDIQNFSLPDGRLKRRQGYKALHEPVVSQALCKSTGGGFTKRLIESQHGKGTIRKTPLSYGLIRNNSQYEWQRGVDKTLEFSFRTGDKEEIIVNPPIRLQTNTTAAWSSIPLRITGVYLIDHTITANKFIWNLGGMVSGVAPVAGTSFNLNTITAGQYTSFPLTGFAVQIRNDAISVTFGMVEKTGARSGHYWIEGSGATLQYNIPGNYLPDVDYHVAISHDASANGGVGALYLHINGVLESTFDFHAGHADFVFCGEWDLINGITHAAGQKRDTVLLNECTARASYSSTCKIRADMHGNQTFYEDHESAPNASISAWCASPPRGTAIWNLRWWRTQRTTAEILANHLIRIDDITDTDLTGNWFLNDGGPVCENSAAGGTEKRCTIHHSYPGYISDANFVNGNAVLLADGQHITKSYVEGERFFGRGVSSQLDSVFEPFKAGAAAHLTDRDQHSFTVMMEIKVPTNFQPELNDDVGGTVNQQDLAGVENRRNMTTGAAPFDGLMDGTAETSVAGRTVLLHAISGNNREQLRAYDQTLFSIEGTQMKDLSSADTVTDEADRRRIPVARATITPDGHVAFELFKSNNVGAGVPYYFRLLSSAVLLPGRVYSLTFVQKVNYVFTTGNLNSDGWILEMHIQDITGGGVTVTTGFTVPAANALSTATIQHAQVYDINIGATMVNDGWDHSISMPFPLGVVAIPKTIFVPGASKRGDSGPWPVTQRFMSPYQDQPANIAVGMFRLWSIALQPHEREAAVNTSIAAKDQTADLLINLEFKSKTGIEIPSFSRYPDSFKLGFKSWGMGEGYRAQLYATLNNSVKLFRSLHESAWANEDCLGYRPLITPGGGQTLPTQEVNNIHTRVNGIMPFKASYGNQYGMLAIYDDAPAYDELADDTFIPQYVANHGLMSEFVPGLDWRGTIIGDRTILTSELSLPKVFNGKNIHPAGFKRWTGGIPICYETATLTSPALTLDKWYGVVVVYISEEYGTYQVSPVAVTNTDTTTAVGLYMVPPHPDLRISAIEVYRTLAQATYSLAKSAPLFKTRVGNNLTTTVGVAGANVFSETLVIDEPDTQLSGVILDRAVTPFPMCAFSAALNERLFLGGDVNNPDRVYYSDPGNPERVDTLFNNLSIPQSSGDVMTGMVEAFNAIYIFKPSAIWRLDDLGGNNFQFTQVSTIGALSSKSIVSFQNPDNGRKQIFFWSHHGPYLFDGQNATYIGYPIEEKEFPGKTAPEYHWLDPSSVVVFHDAEARELVCTYKPVRTNSAGVSTTLDRNGEARVFNYRFSSWYTYTGTICTNAISVSLSSARNTVDATSNTLKSDKYKIYVGGENGRLYSWRGDEYDGLPAQVSSLTQDYVARRQTDDYSYLLPGVHGGSNWIGCWATFYNISTHQWFDAPIVAWDDATLKVTIATGWLDTEYDYDLTTLILADTHVYLCQPFAYVEHAWDELGFPYVDKDVIELATWHDGAFLMRYGHSYRTQRTAWAPLADADSARKRTQLKVKTDAIKLEFLTKELNVTMDAMVIWVKDQMGANTPQ